MPKAKRMSLKLQSQAMKNEVRPPREMAVRLRGRMKKRTMTGEMANSLLVPAGTVLEMVWQ